MTFRPAVAPRTFDPSKRGRSLQGFNRARRTRTPAEAQVRAERCTHNGVRYHSPNEARYARELDLRMKAGDIRSWRRQVRIPLILNGAKWCTYVVDFEIEHNDLRLELVEVKGLETPDWVLKHSAFCCLYPERAIRIVR